MINVKRNIENRPKVFESDAIKIAIAHMAEFYEKPSEIRSQQKYPKPFDKDIRNQFIEQLRIDFNNKCAYCESSLVISDTNPEYDHFRPRHGARGFENEFSQDYYWWLTYEWFNIYLCCSRCNQIKSSWFPVTGNRASLKANYSDVINYENTLLVDPCLDDPEQNFSYNYDGEILAKTIKGAKTIEILQLNRSELIDARKLAGKKIAEDWEYILLESGNYQNKDFLNEILKNWLAVFNSSPPQQYIGYQRYMILEILKQSVADDFFFNTVGEGFNNYGYFDEEKVRHFKQLLIDYRKITEPLVAKDFKGIDAADEFRRFYIERIELKNFKCFSYLELDVNRHSNNEGFEEPLLLLLGESGVGKSSLLKALAIGISGREYIGSLGITGKDLLKKGSEKGFIKIFISDAIAPIEVNFSEESIDSTVSQPLINMIAYNSIRLFPDAGKLLSEGGEYYGAKAKSLFDYTLSLVDAETWLKSLTKEKFDYSAVALKQLMQLDTEDIIFIENDQVFIKFKNGSVSAIDVLSDGYRSLFYLAVDIMATWENVNASVDLLEGVVMIDEIGSHLHPRWRMEIVERLRKTFPRIRFILTTHEPLCLRGVKKNEAVVLVKGDESDIVLLTDLPDPAEMRIDQILTSEFFGLRSTMDSTTERTMEEYYSILSIPEKDRTNSESKRLNILKKDVPRIKHLGNSEREDIVYYVIDELLAKKTREKESKTSFDLKKEALEKVKKLWAELDNEGL